jgi:squalene-hopene/tetraprenyl-beta-curcumene cyclase
MWLALMLAGRGGDQSPRVDVTKMTKRITESPLGKSTEWYALRLLFARQQADNQTVEMMARKLQQQQSVDGGWAWLVGEKSDALGTALSLYALLRSGIGDPQTIARARQFLVDSQQADGSWPVSGTKTKTQNRIAETATYWGTTWAVIALTESLHP